MHRWLASGYDLEIRTCLEVASMLVTWWIVAFLRCELWKCFSSPNPYWYFYTHQFLITLQMLICNESISRATDCPNSEFETLKSNGTHQICTAKILHTDILFANCSFIKWPWGMLWTELDIIYILNKRQSPLSFKLALCVYTHSWASCRYQICSFKGKLHSPETHWG